MRSPPGSAASFYGPWISAPLPRLRAAIAKEIKIRNYPDITHSVVCQYPVHNWDLAFALTLHRECYNPRPLAMKAIHNLFADCTCGSLCYSEGINDDVNKFVWLDQDWDPSTPAVETLRQYARLFIHPDFGDELAQGFLAEERNWEGPLAVCRQVDVTLQQWRDLEKSVPPATRANYRFHMGLLRAYYDAYVKRRLIHETELEAMALDVLRMQSAQGSLAALAKAESILGRAGTEPVAADFKRKCEELANSLFETIGSQLDVKKHGAQSRTRGAFHGRHRRAVERFGLAAGAIPPRPPVPRRTGPAGGRRSNPQPHQSRTRRILRQPGDARRRATDRQSRALGRRPGHPEIAANRLPLRSGPAGAPRRSPGLAEAEKHDLRRTLAHRVRQPRSPGDVQHPRGLCGRVHQAVEPGGQ